MDEKFQSLIGKVQLIIVSAEVDKITWKELFQSLIGKVQRNSRVKKADV